MFSREFTQISKWDTQRVLDSERFFRVFSNIHRQVPTSSFLFFY